MVCSQVSAGCGHARRVITLCHYGLLMHVVVVWEGALPVSEQDESVHLESRGPWSGQWGTSEGDVDGRVDSASEPWRIARSVANPLRLRLGVAQQAVAAGVPSRL